MKVIYTFFIFFFVTYSLHSLEQVSIEYNFNERDENYFKSNWFSSHKFWDLYLDNIITFKKQEKTGENHDYRINNYYLHNVRISKFSENYYVSAKIAGEFLFDDNQNTHIKNISGKIRRDYSLSAGLDFQVKKSFYTIKGQLKSNSEFFKRHQDSNNEKINDNNLILDSEFAFSKLKSITPYLAFFRFDDLNKNNALNYDKLSLGIRGRNKFLLKSYLRYSVAMGYNTIYEDYPIFHMSDFKMTKKITQDWMLSNRFLLNLWISDTEDQLTAVNNSFIETKLSRIFAFNSRNLIKNVFGKIRYYLDDSELIFSSGFNYNLGNFLLSSELEYFISDQFFPDYLMNTRLSYLIFENYRIIYTFNFRKFETKANNKNHSLALEIAF